MIPADIQAYIFDMDGTLLDSEIVWVQAVEEFMRAKGAPVSREEAVSIVYGKSWHDVYTEIVSYSPVLDMPRDQMADALSPVFRRVRDTSDIRIAGSIDLLKRLSRQWPVCIVSGSMGEDVAAGIEVMEIEEHVSFFLAAEDYSPGKPDPACFLAASRRLGVPPEQCLVFEDSAAGVNAAKAAGMYCVALARTEAPPQDFSLADLVLEDLALFDAPDGSPC